MLSRLCLFIVDRKLIFYFRRQFFRLIDHFGQFDHRGYASAQMLLFIDLDEFFLKVFRHTVGKLFYSVHPGSFKQFGKLSGYTLDAEEIGMVDPCQYQLFRYPSHLGYLFATLLVSPAFRRSSVVLIPAASVSLAA